MNRHHCIVNYVEQVRGDLYHVNCASDGGELFVETDGSIANALGKGDLVIFEGNLTQVRGVSFLESVIFIGYWGKQR